MDPKAELHKQVREEEAKHGRARYVTLLDPSASSDSSATGTGVLDPRVLMKVPQDSHGIGVWSSP
eukprot:3613332-Prorocentrum_lima.AAC.1